MIEFFLSSLYDTGCQGTLLKFIEIFFIIHLTLLVLFYKMSRMHFVIDLQGLWHPICVLQEVMEQISLKFESRTWSNKIDSIKNINFKA